MASIESGVLALQNELEKAKENLKGVDENIKKLTGRDPYEQRPGGNRRLSQEGSRGRGRTFTPGGRRFNDGEGQAARRIVGGAFSRLGISPRAAGRGRGRRMAESDEEEDLPNKPTLQSSVILTPKEPKSRQASLDEQKQDQKGKARNRRMFGLLLGTLQKFKDEANESKEKEDQRKQIETKLEDKFREEKEEIIKERRQLFQERRQTQNKLRRIEQKIEIVETSQECQAERLKLVNFIRTKAKPHIFYLPKMMNEVLEIKRKETAAIINELITQKQKQLEEEIEDLMSGRPEHEEGDEEEGGEKEGGEGEENQNKGQDTEKENRITRNYRSKADEIEEQEGANSRKRRKSSGDREDRRRPSGDREKDRKHRKSDEHHRDVHRKESDDRRRSDHADEGRHRRSSHGEGHRRDRGEGERKRSHGESEKHERDESRREERRSHGEGEQDGKKKDHRGKESSKKSDGVKVAIDYDEQDEGQNNEEVMQVTSVEVTQVKEEKPEQQQPIPVINFSTSNMADIPMPDDDTGPMQS